MTVDKGVGKEEPLLLGRVNQFAPWSSSTQRDLVVENLMCIDSLQLRY